MSNPKLEKDLSYLSGWFCGVFFPFGLIGALDFFFRGARRKAFQALMCALPGIFLLIVTIVMKRNPASGPFIAGALLLLPLLTLYYLRTLDWPVPTPLNRGAWVSLIIFLVFIGIVAAIAVPAYSDMGTRSRASYGMSEAAKAREFFDNYYYQNRRFPDNLEQTGFKTQASQLITSISIAEKGTIKLVMGFAPLAGKSVLYIPLIDDNDKIVWKCMSQEIRNVYLPGSCRNETGQ